MNFSFLAQTKLFQGATEKEIEAMLNCLNAQYKTFDKGETIYHFNDKIDHIGLILSGNINIEINHLWGNKSILQHLEPGDIFGETYSFIPDEPLMANAVVAKKAEIIFLKTSKIVISCPNSCEHHNIMIKNLLQLSARQSLSLSRRILHTSSKSIRGRLLSYFSEQVKQSGKYNFTIPFNRQELADYLNVNRSTMCNELSKMADEGIISFDKNTFTIKEDDLLENY